MNAEKLLDAMNYLPETLLEQTDKLRQKRPVYWQRWAALAACLCLVLGIAWAFMIPGATSQDSAAAPEHALGDQFEDVQQSGITGFVRATVRTVEADRLTVLLATGEQRTVLLTEAAGIPALEPGQQIRIYLEDISQTENQILTPYKIELEEA